MKKPLRQPTTCRTRCGHVERSQRPNQRSGQTADRNETKEQRLKTDSPHEPADIGDQYLNIGACTASRQPAPLNGKPAANAALVVSDLSSMCQKRSGRSRSTVRKIPQS